MSDSVLQQPPQLELAAHLYRHGETAAETLEVEFELELNELDTHLERLEAAGVVTTEEVQVEKLPQMRVSLTKQGEERVEAYVERLAARADSLN